MNSNFDVIVIGSGPAGASAAIELAKKNINVLIIEKQSLPRYKTCGGGVIFKANGYLDFKMNQISELNCFTAEINDFKSNLKFITKRENPLVQMVMRKDFDFYLIKKAEEYGAKIIDSLEVEFVNYNSGSIEVRTGKQSFTAKFIIDASGAISNFRNTAESGNKSKKIPALEYEIFVDADIYEKYNKTVRFDFGVVPNGYAWVFPKRGHLSIGVLSMKRNGVNLNGSFLKYMKILGIEKNYKAERHGYVIPIYNETTELYKNRTLLVGDAANLADPITGEGISSAILSGKLAAFSLVEADMNEKLIGNIYNRKLNEKIIKELKAAKFLANFIYGNEKVRASIFRLYGRRLSELITDVITADKKYTEIVKDPLNYFKLFVRWSLKNNKLLNYQNSCLNLYRSSK
jgi:geranylgeranyl reductase family protein